MVILITGASHTGKTLVAQRLLEELDHPYLSIDHLKMGLIRSGYTDLAPEDDDELTDYLWPIVREMMKTAIENDQNLIVEGCYVPPDWREDFSQEYLQSIRFICLAMTDEYIDAHYDDILVHACDIESRLDNSDCTIDNLKLDNRRYIEEFSISGERVMLIDNDFEHSLKRLLDIMSESRLILEEATEKHREAALAMKREFLDAGETVMNGSALLDQMEYDEWLENCIRNSNPDTVADNWAVASTYFAVRKSDKAIVGMIDVRHSLATDFLREYGGHIGYCVRPSERRRGYATEMLGLALDKCREFGIDSVRIGCYASNEASIRTILANGGILVEEKPYIDGVPMRVYEIDLS